MSLQIDAMEAIPGNSVEPWKAGANVLVPSIDVTDQTVTLSISRSGATPPPQGPCGRIRTRFNQLSRDLRLLTQLFQTSDAKRASIAADMDEIQKEIDALVADFRARRCPGTLM